MRMRTRYDSHMTRVLNIAVCQQTDAAKPDIILHEKGKFVLCAKATQ